MTLYAIAALAQRFQRQQDHAQGFSRLGGVWDVRLCVLVRYSCLGASLDHCLTVPPLLPQPELQHLSGGEGRAGHCTLDDVDGSRNVQQHI